MKKYIIAFCLVGMSGGLVFAQDYVSKSMGVRPR